MEYIEYIKLYAKTMFHHLTTPVKKHKILVFNETGNEMAFFEYASNMTIEEIKQRICLDKYKIEVRYTVGARKYRIVIRENDDVKLPIRKELGLMRPRIISASLVRKDTGEEYDVTKRICKYFGQNNDFNSGKGLRIFVHDMFPFDDHEDNAERISVLRLCMTNGNAYEFDYEKNEEIIL